MNILFRDKKTLAKNIQDKRKRLEFYQTNYYDNIYFVNQDGSWNGYINLEGDKKDQVLKICVQSTLSTIKVRDWFRRNPGIVRLPVVDNNVLIGEYYNSLYYGKCLFQKIEDKALSIISSYKQELQEWAKQKNIGIIAKDSTLNLLKDVFPCHPFIPQEKFDVIIDCELVPQFKKMLNIRMESVSLSEILYPIVVHSLVTFLRSHDVTLIAVNGPKKSELPNLTDKEKDNLNRTLEAVLCDAQYVKSFCGRDRHSLHFLQKHKYNLNRISRIVNNGIHNTLIDFSDGDNCNFIDGKRLTTDNPRRNNRSIHFYGACAVQGLCVVDCLTIPSIFQRLLNENGLLQTNVVNHGLAYGKDIINDLLSMMATPIGCGDLLIWLTSFNKLEQKALIENDIQIINLCEIMNKKNYWFLDNPCHCNAEANEIFAKNIYKHIKKECDISSQQGEKCSYCDSLGKPLSYNPDAILDSDEMQQYISYLSTNKFDGGKSSIGGVVMHANPCTNGHIYLINYALTIVDGLYVFIVEESKSGFSYLDREYMLRENFKNDSRVKFISGGNVLTSELSFPEYFNRAKSKTKVSPILNHKVFAIKIAPLLNISKRFFGAEPEDIVTQRLNITAKEFFPKYGIEVYEVERLKCCGKYVSAKDVRNLYRQKKYEQIATLTPFSTYMRLLELSNDSCEDLLRLHRDYKHEDNFLSTKM